MSYPVAESYGPEIQFMGMRLSHLNVPQLHAYVKKVIENKQKALILNINIHMANLCHDLPWLREMTQKAGAVYCDSDGVRWGLRILGLNPPPKITSAGWMDEFSPFCVEQGFSLYFLGSKPGVAERAARRFQERYPGLKIAGTHHGHFDHEGPENEKIIAEINRLKPDILMVGFGMPLQEKWLRDNWMKLDCHLLFPEGAIFEYMSGDVKRAPSWMLAFHMEWLFRLFQQPRRLFSRYILGNPLFFLRIMKEKFEKI